MGVELISVIFHAVSLVHLCVLSVLYYCYRNVFPLKNRGWHVYALIVTGALHAVAAIAEPWVPCPVSQIPLFLTPNIMAGVYMLYSLYVLFKFKIAEKLRAQFEGSGSADLDFFVRNRFIIRHSFLRNAMLAWIGFLIAIVIGWVFLDSDFGQTSGPCPVVGDNDELHALQWLLVTVPVSAAAGAVYCACQFRNYRSDGMLYKFELVGCGCVAISELLLGLIATLLFIPQTYKPISLTLGVGFFICFNFSLIVPLTVAFRPKLATGADDSLNAVLTSPIHRANFVRYLEHEFSVENIMFYDAVQAFVQHGNSLAHAGELSRKFLEPNSPFTVNVSSKSKNAIFTELHNCERGQAPLDNLRNAFSAAAQEVRTLMERDTFPRYCRSNLRAELSSALQGPSSELSRLRTESQGNDVEPSPLAGSRSSRSPVGVSASSELFQGAATRGSPIPPGRQI